MQYLTLTLKIALIWLVLFLVKNLVVYALTLLTAIRCENPRLLRALCIGALAGAALGMGAALRADLSVALLMPATAICAVLTQASLAMMLGVQRKQDWAWRVFDAVLAS